jgi:hypothetical protein
LQFARSRSASAPHRGSMQGPPCAVCGHAHLGSAEGLPVSLSQLFSYALSTVIRFTVTSKVWPEVSCLYGLVMFLVHLGIMMKVQRCI